MNLLSVVIAAYNQENEIGRAVRSALSQDVQDLEVIVVNDGSEDRTGDVLRKLAAEDARLRVITKENGGVSAARNDGIRTATGKWLLTLDGDDFFEPGIFRKLLAEGLPDQESVDLVISGMLYDYGDRTEEFEPEKTFDGNLRAFLSGPFCPLYDTHLLTTHCNKLYRLDLLRKNGILFREELAINEDIDFVFRYLRVCERIRILRAPCIHYVQHPAGKSQITTFREYGIRSSLLLLREFEELKAKADKAAAEEGTEEAYGNALTAVRNRLFVHILSFTGLMYRDSGYSVKRKREELEALSGDPDFRTLLGQVQPEDLKTAVAGKLLGSGKTGIYHMLCRGLYR